MRWRWTPNSFAIWDNRCTQHYAVQDYWPAVRKMERAGIVGDPPPSDISSTFRTDRTEHSAMYFLDDSLFPENQEKLVITAAPYGPEWAPADFPEDIPLTMDQHVQQAVDCWNAGATVLHMHVRELDGKGSKRLSQFNELLAPAAPRRAGDDPAGRRFDLLRPGRRGRRREVAGRRRPAHARRSRPQARPGDHRDQHLADEHRRADDRRGHRGNLVRAARSSGRPTGTWRCPRARRGSRSTCAGWSETASSHTSSWPTPPSSKRWSGWSAAASTPGRSTSPGWRSAAASTGPTPTR